MREIPANPSDHPCELVDIEAMITRLYISGRISIKHLEILKKYDERRLVPNDNLLLVDAEIWDHAISIIAHECKKKRMD